MDNNNYEFTFPEIPLIKNKKNKKRKQPDDNFTRTDDIEMKKICYGFTKEQLKLKQEEVVILNAKIQNLEKTENYKDQLIGKLFLLFFFSFIFFSYFFLLL